MRDRSEFQTILESKLEEPQFDRATPSSLDLESWIKSLEGDFVNSINANYAQKTYRMYMRDLTKVPPPPPKKRDFSPEQLGALNVLIQFGEKQLSEFSTDQEIKKAFRTLAKLYHPDGKKADAKVFRDLFKAYKALIK